MGALCALFLTFWEAVRLKLKKFNLGSAWALS